MSKILVFGDSISWGAFDTEAGGWVERLKAHYLGLHKNIGVDIYNMSVSSNDTRGVLEFLETDIMKINKIEPEELILLFSIGSNDPRYIDDKVNIVVPEDEFRENLYKVISMAKVHSERIIFTGLMKVDESLSKPWSENEYWENEDLEKYDSIIELTCAEENIEFIPLINTINNNDLFDGLHPNTQGHKKIFKRILEYLEK